MIFLTCWTIFCIIITTCTSSVASSPVAEFQDAQKWLQLTLKSLQDTLDFFSTEYQNVNLDAVIGTRMVAGECFEYFISIILEMAVSKAF